MGMYYEIFEIENEEKHKELVRVKIKILDLLSENRGIELADEISSNHFEEWFMEQWESYAEYLNNEFEINLTAEEVKCLKLKKEKDLYAHVRTLGKNLDAELMEKLNKKILSRDFHEYLNYVGLEADKELINYLKETITELEENKKYIILWL